MKKFWITAAIFGIFVGTNAFSKQLPLNAEPVAPDYEKASQDAERNRELLEIWKEHVKTLTKERDDAYRQIERLKAGGTMPAGQFGVETAPLPSAEATQQIAGLQTEVGRLQEELQKKAAGSPNRELQMQFSAMQKQMQSMQKELNEARSEKDRLIQEKERALGKAERLEGEIEGLRTSGPSASGAATPAATDAFTENIQKAYDILKRRYEDLEQRFHGLERENETLRTRSSAEDAARPEDSARIEELERQLQVAQQAARAAGDSESTQRENASLRSEVLRLKQANAQLSSASGSPDLEREAFVRQARELEYENDTLKAQIEKMQAIEKELASTRGYFTPLVKELQQKNDSLASDNTTLRSETQRIRLQADQSSQELANLRTQNKQYEKELDNTTGQIQALQADAQRSNADLQVLKTQYQDALKASQAEQQQAQAQVEQLNTQIAGFRSELQAAAADREKLKSAETQLVQLKDQNEALQKGYAALESSYKERDSQYQQLSEQVASLKADSRQLEKYRTALKANLGDMKNLKANFEAYLESLVASFDERQK